MSTETIDETEEKSDECNLPNLESVINEYFIAKQLFLNPSLKLSDMALSIGTNRTYLSRYINERLHTTFYDYVNGLRIDYAVNMIQTSDLSIRAIAVVSGFNSYSTFRRAFIQKLGKNPQEYRQDFQDVA